MEIIYRQARKEDCEKLGLLTSIAGGGLLEFLLDGLVPGMTAAEVTAHDLAENKGVRSYRNVMVAEVNKQVKGMAFSYHSRHHGIDQELREFVPEERLQPLEPLFSARVENSLYLDTLAVDQDLRGRGVGKKLVELTKRKALDMGLDSLSLIVNVNNQDALGLYRNLGFQAVREIPLQILELEPNGGDSMLMECKLA